MAATSISFGEWLPDQPELENQLITAKNVLPLAAGYSPFLPLDTSMATLNASSSINSVSAAYQAGGATKAADFVYACQLGAYYDSSQGTFAFTARGSATSGGVTEQFTQYGNLIISVGELHEPKAHTNGSTSNFVALATSGTAPEANCVAIVGQFVVVGCLDVGTLNPRPSTLQWSAINDPRNWPTPNSATATATQAGEQIMDLALGAIQSIHGGDQYAVILQQKGVSRMTYEGPPSVFNFDVIDTTQGSVFRHGSAQVGTVVYFLSMQGFCRTDGVTVQRIGLGKVDQFLWKNIYPSATMTSVRAGYDPTNELVYFGFPTTSAGTIDTVMVFNPNTNKWAYANQSVSLFVTPRIGYGDPIKKLLGFNYGSQQILGEFNGPPGTAIFLTGDIEMNPGGRSFINGVKPHVEYSGTAPAVTVRVGTRDDLGASTSYSATTTPTTRTGFADFRKDGKYARAEVQVVGTFTKATGLEFHGIPSGEA